MGLVKGVIRKMDRAKGYGFIRSGNEDFFFHRQDLMNNWNELYYDFNQNESEVIVQFLADKTPKGLRARNVSLFKG